MPSSAVALGGMRPPAVPLIVHDPYFSVWSFADRLTDDDTRHWTGTPQPLCSMVRIDGQPYRLMGAEPREVAPLPQVGLEVLPTRTVYQFRSPAVALTLTFFSPALPQDLDSLSLPVSYLTWSVRSVDGMPHRVALYFDATAALAVNQPSQAVVWSRETAGSLVLLRAGSQEQPILQKKGDNLRIDWGYLYAASRRSDTSQSSMAAADACRAAFAQGRPLPADDLRMPRLATDAQPALAIALDLGSVGEKPAARTAMLAYDELYAITYFHHRLRPYWRRRGMGAAAMLRRAERNFARLDARGQALDQELMADLAREGGEEYARLCALAYRQCLGANQLAADDHGQPLLFPKENFSNGCISTVDVIYPMEPLFLLTSPTLVKASVVPILEYARSDHWHFPFAPHDLGTFPQANGQVYGGGERTEENQMPVEESANMLLLLAALARSEGNARFAEVYWPLLEKWADYLKAKGLDPERQLCTDDFAGHLAHNVNLSAKAIEALGAFSLLCAMHGDSSQAEDFSRTAHDFARQWVRMAEDGDHYRLAFDKPGTWSQKYNLVWDRILGLNLFPERVFRTEVNFYEQHLNQYGLPLDNRKDYTKLDWSVWSASLAGRSDDFARLIAPIDRWLNESTSRVPMTDWYMTTDGKKVGFQARPVVGGVFIKMLLDPAVWQRWASRDPDRAGGWAPLPHAPVPRAVVPTAQTEAIVWRYALTAPPDGWYQPGFDDSGWKEAPGGFGSQGTPSAVIRTEWTSDDIWLRRSFMLPAGRLKQPQLLLHHDEDAEVYLNGILAARVLGYTTDYDPVEMAPAARAGLRPGRNVLAVHCHQTVGGQYIDVGIIEAK